MNQEAALSASAPLNDVPAVRLKEGVVTALLGITVMLVVMNTMMFNLALPQVTRDFGLTSTAASWIVTGYSIVFAISSITYSRLSDFLPIRRLLLIGLASLGAASVLGFFSHHFALLLCARLVQASGAASVPALGMVLITRFVPAGRRGKSMSVIMSASSLGLGLGPVIGGAITQYLGWNDLFIVTGIVLFLIPFFYRLLPAEPVQKGSFDTAGSLLIGIGTTGLLLFLTSRSWLLLAAGIVALGLFWVRIHRSANPFVQPALFRNKPYLLLSGIGIVSYMNNFAALFLLPQVLAHLYDLTPGQSGLVIFPGAMLSALASNRIGRLIDRFGNGLLFRYAPWMLLASAVLFALFVSTSFYTIMVLYAMLSLSFSALTTSVSNELSQMLPKEQIGAGMGLFQLTQFFSGAFSVALTGSALTWQKSLTLPQAYSNIYWGLTVVVLVGIACAFSYSKQKQGRFE
ncbi:MFS transporter [Paenibacillus sp. y28]|uniref:MFS transporter n=1 Tax=Paenibacillus sp. y28 TaxID=3129110 RepID=UPI00301AA6F6